MKKTETKNEDVVRYSHKKNYVKLLRGELARGGLVTRRQNYGKLNLVRLVRGNPLAVPDGLAKE